jgi:hypothetical protein
MTAMLCGMLCGMLRVVASSPFTASPPHLRYTLNRRKDPHLRVSNTHILRKFAAQLPGLSDITTSLCHACLRSAQAHLQVRTHQGSRPYRSSRPGPMMPMSSNTPARAAMTAPAPPDIAPRNDRPMTQKHVSRAAVTPKAGTNPADSWVYKEDVRLGGGRTDVGRDVEEGSRHCLDQRDAREVLLRRHPPRGDKGAVQHGQDHLRYEVPV